MALFTWEEDKGEKGRKRGLKYNFSAVSLQLTGLRCYSTKITPPLGHQIFTKQRKSGAVHYVENALHIGNVNQPVLSSHFFAIISLTHTHSCTQTHFDCELWERWAPTAGSGES